MQFSGNGVDRSPPFLVSTSPVNVSYTYDCTSLGTSGNFIAYLTTSPSSPTSDTEAIANVIGASGSTSATVSLRSAGSDYYVQVDSECQWALVVKSG